MTNRSEAINAVAGLRPAEAQRGVAANIDFYGEDVFNTAAMAKYLPRPVAEKLLDTINNGASLDPSIAADVALGMKDWALERGATHYTHWFLPLTGSTAEKHDSFMEPDGEKAILAFSGKNLIVGESDASSFPSGGLRCTFEARGYTAWDPTSPAFIKRHANGATLCIPTVFFSYTGETLDKKTPLLRSTQALSIAVKRLMKCFNLPDAKVQVTLGAEQEYFLIDKRFYLQRPDLIQTGRTLFGATPPKHQQLEDHYFGSIKHRVLAFMTEVERDLWRLGIPAKTRHNEVAPAQFELAPIFEDINLASDHNMLVMEVLRQTADRHGLVCLLHEKPFQGVNGSGKHNNWSISYGDMQLLKPGKEPHQNAIFLTLLVAILRSLDLHGDMLRASVAGAGNDHRLGANEAPPAIISAYLGDQLNEVIASIESGSSLASKKEGVMRVGVDTLPELPVDATDRNRTSPFAFTSNKFEFRSPGSSQSCAGPMTVLNTMVADSIDFLADRIEKFGKESFNDELQALLREVVRKHKRIIFNGDGYTDNWRQEAEKRGLPNAANTMDALPAMTRTENLELFARYKVFSTVELTSRFEVFQEEYHRKIGIEGQLSLDIARGTVLPVVVNEYGKAVSALKHAKSAGVTAGIAGMEKRVENLGKGLDDLTILIDAMAEANNGEHEDIIRAMKNLRSCVDKLEGMVDDSVWPLPKYREMLFIY